MSTREIVRVGLPYRFDTSYTGTLVFKAAGPEGRFPIAYFESIGIEWRPCVPTPGVQMPSGISECIYLLGKDGTPDIETARLTDESGRARSRELGLLLSLPVEERPAPGAHGSRD